MPDIDLNKTQGEDNQPVGLSTVEQQRLSDLAFAMTNSSATHPVPEADLEILDTVMSYEENFAVNPTEMSEEIVLPETYYQGAETNVAVELNQAGKTVEVLNAANLADEKKITDILNWLSSAVDNPLQTKSELPVSMLRKPVTVPAETPSVTQVIKEGVTSLFSSAKEANLWQKKQLQKSQAA